MSYQNYFVGWPKHSGKQVSFAHRGKEKCWMHGTLQCLDGRLWSKPLGMLTQLSKLQRTIFSLTKVTNIKRGYGFDIFVCLTPPTISTHTPANCTTRVSSLSDSPRRYCLCWASHQHLRTGCCLDASCGTSFPLVNQQRSFWGCNHSYSGLRLA